MSKYVLKRVLGFIPMLLAISFMSFLIMAVSPIDPAAMYLRPGEEAITQEKIDQIRKSLGLDRPIIVRYTLWLKEALKGNLGYSLYTNRPVMTEISERIGTTVLISLLSLSISFVIGISLGIYAARHRYEPVDYVITVATFLGVSMPNFYLAILFILLFTMKLGWLPSVGLTSPGLAEASGLTAFLDTLRHLIMPVTVTALSSITGWTRSQRTMFLEVINQEYIRTARSKGLSERTIIWKHAFRNSCLPIVTSLGLSLPSLISGSYIVETIFAIPGLGSLGTTAIMKNDYPVMMATLMFSSILTLTGALLTDILYAAIDPRVRYR
jgi:peptide/nickel transport system permease protein